MQWITNCSGQPPRVSYAFENSPRPTPASVAELIPTLQERRSMRKTTRRDLLKSTAAATVGSVLLPSWFTLARTMASESQAPNDRPRVGCIGLGGMGQGDAQAAKRYGDIVAICAVDLSHPAPAA